MSKRRNLKTWLVMTVFLLGMLSTTFAGQIIYVDTDAPGPAGDGSSWTDAYNYLQDALADANSGDEIRVAQGIYKPDQGVGITPCDRTATFQLINGIAIKGGHAGFGEPDPNARDIELYETILSGDLNGDDGPDFARNWDNSYHVVTGSETDATAALEGFTITAGNDDQIDPDMGGPWGVGGGMYNRNGSPTLTNCTFGGNSANLAGGGMLNHNSGPTLLNCTFSGNATDYYGGGMYNGTGPGNTSGSPTLTNCTFSGNSAGDGGGMYNNYSRPTLVNCEFVGNLAKYGGGMSRGGGIYNFRKLQTLTNCIFRGNSADYGGGMYNTRNSPTLTSCTFGGNSAEDNGGAMYNQFNNPVLMNCLFKGNLANSGGGMYNWDSSPTLTSSTFAGNSGTNGSALACDSSRQMYPGNLELTNCILWDGGKEIWNNDNSVITITYSDVQGGWTGLGNIDVDPLFVEPGYWADANDPNVIVEPNDPNAVWVDGDYHLKSEGWRWDTNRKVWTWDYGTSPCIDAGNPGCPLGDELMTVPPDPANEYGINIRINMGAYGGTAQASMPPYGWALLGDMSNDGTVDYEDLAGQLEDWLTTASQQPGDLNRDGTVNMADFALLAQDWLAKTSWYKPPIVLEIYALGCWGVYLLDTVTMPEEGEITITSELPPQSSYAFVYAFREGYYTEIYKLDESNTINVDLDPIVPTKFNGTIFLTDPFFTALYLADTDVNVIDGDTVVGQFRTDEQGRFAIEMEPGNYYFEFYECASGFGGYHREEVEIQGQYKDFFFHYDSMVDKPNIYLYPEETIEVDVNIVFPHGGRLRTSIPEYGDGWHITVEPSGIIDGQYDCLFYESLQPDYGQYEAGWVVAQGQLEGFFRDNMALTGFNQKEIDDFIEYWIPRLTEYPYYAIYPQYNDELEEMIKLEFSEQPTNLIRLIYSVRGLETGNLTLDEAVIPAFNRDGFTVAEWGVILKQ